MIDIGVYVYIDVSTNKHPSSYVLIDAENYRRISKYNWHVCSNGRNVYARTTNSGAVTSISLMKFISGIKAQRLYPINADNFDCRISNITSIYKASPKGEYTNAKAPKGCRLLDISTKTHPNKYCIVDDFLFDELNKHRWCFGERYVVRSSCLCGSNSKLIFLHKYVFGYDGDLNVDHKNGNTLDNRRSNLRLADNNQNTFNMAGRSKTGAKGVYENNKGGRKYYSQISKKGIRISLGSFDSVDDASNAYSEASKVLHGEYGTTRHVLGTQETMAAT